MCLVENGCDINIKCHGTPPLHLTLTTTVLPGGYEFGLSAALKLLSMGCDVNAKVVNIMRLNTPSFIMGHSLLTPPGRPRHHQHASGL